MLCVVASSVGYNNVLHLMENGHIMLERAEMLKLEERVPLFGANTSDQQASKTVDKHHQAREEIENQRERERERGGGGGGVQEPAFTVRHVVVLLTTVAR